ncbi:hypothetical protein ABW21_db0207047 [Orbilia brochopaga]|nr:hypothetical protein ABW21_db0207047 [Drechslerella brochopaga]
MRSLIILTALTTAASAATFTVDINGLAFSPDSITAAVGDTVTFTFAGGNHTVTESTFDDPCNPLANGFNSGWTGSSSETFTITVTSTAPIYFMCAAPGHCKAGMVGIINPPSSGNTLAAFKDAAAGADQTSFPSDAIGGVISVQGGSVSTAPGGAVASSAAAAPTVASNSSGIAPFSNSSAVTTAAAGAGAASVTSVPATLAVGNVTILGNGTRGGSATIAVIGPSITGNFTGTLPTPPAALGAAASLAVGFMTTALCVLTAIVMLA